MPSVRRVRFSSLSHSHVARRVAITRSETWEERDGEGRPLRRTLGFCGLGGATLDTEENYLIKKAFCALGAVSIENQARI